MREFVVFVGATAAGCILSGRFEKGLFIWNVSYVDLREIGASTSEIEHFSCLVCVFAMLNQAVGGCLC